MDLSTECPQATPMHYKDVEGYIQSPGAGKIAIPGITTSIQTNLVKHNQLLHVEVPVHHAFHASFINLHLEAFEC